MSKFETFPIKYQNLSNRMQRLRQHSQTHCSTSTLQRSSSVEKVQSKPLSRNISSTLLINASPLNVIRQSQDTLIDLGHKYTGRVAKNTGIRKYNQRMLKEIGNVHSNLTRKSPNKSPVRDRTKSPSRSPAKLNNINNCPEQVSSLIKEQTFVEKYNIRSFYGQNVEKQRKKLEPGKIYSREELEKYFG